MHTGDYGNYQFGSIHAPKLYWRARGDENAFRAERWQGKTVSVEQTKYFLPVILIFLGVIYLIRSLDGEIRDFDITQYEKATVVGTLGNSKDRIKITTLSGVNATISSVPINSISIKFQDEEKDREIYHTHLIQLAETRRTIDRDILFIKISGWYMTRLNEEAQEEKIFVYNLSKRKLIGWAKI